MLSGSKCSSIFPPWAELSKEMWRLPSSLNEDDTGQIADCPRSHHWRHCLLFCLTFQLESHKAPVACITRVDLPEIDVMFTGFFKVIFIFIAYFQTDRSWPGQNPPLLDLCLTVCSNRGLFFFRCLSKMSDIFFHFYISSLRERNIYQHSQLLSTYSYECGDDYSVIIFFIFPSILIPQRCQVYLCNSGTLRSAFFLQFFSPR